MLAASKKAFVTSHSIADLLCVTIFAGKSVLSSSPEIAERLEKKPELMAALMELFENKSLVTTKGEETDEKPEVKMNRPLILPPL